MINISDIVESTELEVQFTDGVSPYVGLAGLQDLIRSKVFLLMVILVYLELLILLFYLMPSVSTVKLVLRDVRLLNRMLRTSLKELQTDEQISLLPLVGLGVSYKF
jgi:hypothetical protein